MPTSVFQRGTTVSRSKLIPFLLILPTVAYLGILMGYPLVENVRLAFSNPAGALENFRSLVSTKEFWQTLTNTLLLTVFIVPLQLILALALALFINKKFRGYTFVLYLITIPLALSDITASLMSYSIFAPSGYFNKILINLGILERPMYFFGYFFKERAFWIVVLTEVWRATPLVFVILLAGLQSINKEYLEAADVFGFSKWKKFTKITLPLLKPTIMSALLIRTIFAFQIFGVVWLLAGRDITVLAGETYYWYVFMNNPNMASAYALIIALVTFVFSAIYIFALRSKHLEEGVGT